MADAYDMGYRMNSTKDVDAFLEGLVDRDGLDFVVRRLGNLCHEKGAHLQENWQDSNHSKEWFEVGNLLDDLHEHIVANTYIP